MYWQKISNPFFGPKEVRPLLVVRGLTGFTALSGMFFSLKYLSLSDAVVLRFIAPILTGFTGTIFLKERVSLKEFVAGLCGFSGVVLIARPQALFGATSGSPLDGVKPGQRMISITAALIGVVAATGSYTLLRAIGKRAHALHVNTYFSAQCVLLSTIGMIIFNVHPVIPTRVLTLVLMFLVSLLGLAAQTFLAMGFQRETASRGSLAMYTSIVFAVMFEFIVFGTIPTPLSMAGAIIIISSAIYTSLMKRAASQPATNSIVERGPLANPSRDDDQEAQ